MKLKEIDKIGLSAKEINSLVVSSFLRNHPTKVELNTVLRENNICNNSPIAVYLPLFKNVLTIEDVISVFEQSIPADEVVTNGAIYTPEYIRERIIDVVCNGRQQKNTLAPDNWSCVDISCGCGAFLYSYAKRIKAITGNSYSSILDNIYGVDISENSIMRSKILLSLMALTDGESVDSDRLHLFVTNALSFDFRELTPVRDLGGFDLVVGNPPYVRSKHIDKESRALLNRWQVARIGNADLYLPFFEIGLSILNENGFLGYITVNSFFKSVNARSLRKYIHANAFNVKILNFGQELIFKKKLAYTCLAFFSKGKGKGVEYAKVSSKEVVSRNDIKTELIPFTELDAHKGWNLCERRMLRNIELIERSGTPLSEYCIRNGIATLANDIFIFAPEKEDSEYYYANRLDLLWPIEKHICKNIIKPNILKSESDILSKLEKVIFPYNECYEAIPEDEFVRKYPKAYAYLSANQKRLLERDKGSLSYKWYEFGRNQAINYKGKKLMFPYMSDTPKFVYTNDTDMLIYCGYAFYDESTENLLLLKRILESGVFFYYIKHTSKPYSTGYYSYAKNYIKTFSICPLPEKDKKTLLNLTDKYEIDLFLCKAYQLDSKDIL